MKRLLRILLVLISVIFVVGLGLSIGGIAMGASMSEMSAALDLKSGYRAIWNIVEDDEWDDEWEEDDHHLLPSDEEGDSRRVYRAEVPEELKIELRADELILKIYDGTDILIEVENDEEENVRVKTEDHGRELAVKSIHSRDGRKITMSFPEDSKIDEVDLQMDAGSVRAEDAFSFGKLKLETGAGEFVSEERITADEAEFELGAGTLEMKLLDAGRVKGECGLGTVELTLAGARTDYSYELECGMGSIIFDREEYSGLAQERKSSGGNAGRSLKLECGMGEMEILFEN